MTINISIYNDYKKKMNTIFEIEFFCVWDNAAKFSPKKVASYFVEGCKQVPNECTRCKKQNDGH